MESYIMGLLASARFIPFFETPPIVGAICGWRCTGPVS